MSDQSLPQHVALIPDGNRRWARGQGMEPSLGHEAGVKRFWEISEELFKKGVPVVTLWGASIDNIKKRSALEIQFLVELAKRYFADKAFVQRFVDNDVRVRVVGKWNELLHDTDFAHAVAEMEQLTADCKKFTLTILFGYNGIDEMLDAIPKAAAQSERTYESVMQTLTTGFLPPVDLVIRTGGEPHWSAGFMMWHTANSQFHFTETLWPAFDAEHLEQALAEFASRERRMGK